MEAAVAAGAAEAAVVVDLDEDRAAKAAAQVGCDRIETSLEAALSEAADGVVLATPSGLHAEQALQVLERGLPVFVQKPLARTTRETTLIVDTARAGDLLLGVDMSYRYIQAFAAGRAAAASGSIGDVYAMDLVFHNRFGPDKAWALDVALSGGGCMIDLGSHLVDMALRIFDAEAQLVSAQLFAKGIRLGHPPRGVEDHAFAELDMGGGRLARIECSWFMAADRDATIACRIYGSQGSVSICNVDGSFYDFLARRHTAGGNETLSEPPDDWGGRALIAWAQRLREEKHFDPEVSSTIPIARVIDSVYGRTA